jgi:hypothetical protein
MSLTNQQVEILSLRLLLQDGSQIKGFADIKVGDWIIRDWRIIKQNGKPLQVIAPQVSWRGQKGEMQYKTIVTLPDELRGQIDFAILKRFTEELEKDNARSRSEQ